MNGIGWVTPLLYIILSIWKIWYSKTIKRKKNKICVVNKNTIYACTVSLLKHHVPNFFNAVMAVFMELTIKNIGLWFILNFFSFLYKRHSVLTVELNPLWLNFSSLSCPFAVVAARHQRLECKMILHGRMYYRLVRLGIPAKR